MPIKPELVSGGIAEHQEQKETLARPPSLIVSRKEAWATMSDRGEGIASTDGPGIQVCIASDCSAAATVCSISRRTHPAKL